jgi:hypothetical protein
MRMVTEKVKALADAQTAGAVALAQGKSVKAATKRAMTPIKRSVRANHRPVDEEEVRCRSRRASALSEPDAASWLRLRSGQQKGTTPGHPGLARSSVDHQHGHLHGAGAKQVQGLLAGLIRAADAVVDLRYASGRN